MTAAQLVLMGPVCPVLVTWKWQISKPIDWGNESIYSSALEREKILNNYQPGEEC